MKRFFFHTDQRKGELVTLSAEESRHICKVLRLTAGQRVELYDGGGSVYTAEIIDAAKSGNKTVKLRILQQSEESPLSSGKIVIGQGIIATRKMELLLQKLTELGVDGFVPVVSRFSQGDRVRQHQAKQPRFQKLIVEACKQCRRPRPMVLQPIQPFGEMIEPGDVGEKGVKLLFWEKERETTLASWRKPLKQNGPVVLLFGPEGGFSEEEVEQARQRGFATVGLGGNILRAETAAIAAVSIVQHYRGNM